MEELRGHRRPIKSSFGHVHSAPFPAKSDAYGEIFDEMANSCSIPFLDLPPPAESFDGGSIAYSEIFCGVKGGDFAVDYEEVSKKGVESLDSSSERVYTDAKFGQKEERSGLSPEVDIFKHLDAPCVRTSDIKLQTKPSKVAPPAKTPPKMIHKQENTKTEMPRSSIGDQEGNLLKPSRNHQIRYKLGAPKSRGFQTSDFLDVEVDAGSAAAASVAAMKEAMEQAQARLERAKELMERQRDSNERRKNLGHRDGTGYDARKDAKAFEEFKNFREGSPNKTLPMEDKEMKDYAFNELQNFTEVGKAPPDHEESHADEIGENLNACNMTSKKEIRKTPEKSRGASALKDSLTSDYQDVNQKLHAAYGSLVSGVELTKPNSGKKASCGETEMDVRYCDNAFKIGEALANRAPAVVVDNVKTDLLRSNHTEGENGKFKDSTGAAVSEVTHNLFDAAQDRAENKDIGGVKQVSRAEKEDIRVAAPEISIERKYEKEQARKAGEVKVMEGERDEDRRAVERAAREEHERAVSEARERAERIAVERATAEARQRSASEARGKAQKASAEALEKSSLEKALKEAKLRAERAAVERATAEARERAVEKAIAEKAAADARRRAERLNANSRNKSRKDNEAGGSGMGDSGIKLKASSSDVLHDASFQCAGSSGSSQIHADSTAYGEEESALRCKARSERHQRTVERAAKALAEKNSRDVVAQREEEERDRFAEMLDADVRRWSAGKEGNLRAMLSTLQYILGPESGWQSIPLTDVITAAAVKKAYRKATLFVHPDKLQQRGASIQQKYICEKVFDLLKEAWNKFDSEE